jgi:hypothetical protein
MWEKKDLKGGSKNIAHRPCFPAVKREGCREVSESVSEVVGRCVFFPVCSHTVVLKYP